jgi:hypothetical protein
MTAPTSPADRHDLDPLRIIETFERHQVDYLLVGGLAATVHGATRTTYDFDCLADRSSDNLDRLAAALIELGARYRVEGLTDEESRRLPVVLDRQTLHNSSISTWRTDAGDLDVLTEMSVGAGIRLDYDDLFEASSSATLQGGPVRIAALDDIIASKRHANRGKDQVALPELDRLARGRSPQPDMEHDDFDLS